MWEKPDNFAEIRDVYLKEKSRTDSEFAGMKAIRDSFALSLVEAKNLMYWIEDDCDIVEAQSRLFGDPESIESQLNGDDQAE